MSIIFQFYIHLYTTFVEGQRCPEDPRHYIQHSNCDHSPSCVTYHWEASDWSTCVPSNNKGCGNGTQTRITRCFKNTGEEVSFKRYVYYTICTTFKTYI